MLRHTADASTAELFQEKLEMLRNSEYWMNHPKLSRYITDHYLSIKEVKKILFKLFMFKIYHF